MKRFMNWVIPKLKQDVMYEDDVIYQEGDKIQKLIFLGDGQAGFVLPHYRNSLYIMIEKGDHFWHLDIAGSFSLDDFNFDNPRENQS